MGIISSWFRERSRLRRTPEVLAREVGNSLSFLSGKAKPPVFSAVSMWFFNAPAELPIMMAK